MATKLFSGTRRLSDAYLSEGITLAVHRCGECGVIFGYDSDFDTQRKRDHASWYCPNGHLFSYTSESDIERAKRERDEAQRREQATRDLLSAEELSHRATRGHLTRVKRRVSHGVCPCCNRSFSDLRRHMDSKHPGYAPS